MLDINVLMDVLQKRNSRYESSSKVVSLGLQKRFEAVIPGHAPTTIYYLVRRNVGQAKALEALDWLLTSFLVAPATHEIYARARKLDFSDFEDGVVAAMAEHLACHYIVTGNVEDFAKSPVQAITPAHFLPLVISESL